MRTHRGPAGLGPEEYLVLRRTGRNSKLPTNRLALAYRSPGIEADPTAILRRTHPRECCMNVDGERAASRSPNLMPRGGPRADSSARSGCDYRWTSCDVW
jgi:hypothetical protein